MLYFHKNHIHKEWKVNLCIWGSSYVIKINILMSEQKNTAKQPADHIDFNLNLKTTLSPLFDAQKSIYKKKKKNPYVQLLIFWSHLFRPTFPSDTKYRTRE